VTHTRRRFAFLSSTIALIAVALLASSGSLAASVTRASYAALAAAGAAGRPSVDGEKGQASEPGDRGRTAFLHAQAPSTLRIHASQTNGGDGARNALALGGEHARLDFAARHAPGAAVDARQDGVASPGQPAPSSRAPPIG
jgi:hypothetical protein